MCPHRCHHHSACNSISQVKSASLQAAQFLGPYQGYCSASLHTLAFRSPCQTSMPPQLRSPLQEPDLASRRNPSAKTFSAGERGQEIPSSLLHYCRHPKLYLLSTSAIFADTDLGSQSCTDTKPLGLLVAGTATPHQADTLTPILRWKYSPLKPCVNSGRNGV